MPVIDVQNTIVTPQSQTIEKIVEIPEIQTIQGARTSESLGTAPCRHVAFSEVVEVVELEPPPSAESAPPVFVVEKIQEQIVEAIEAIP